MSMPSQAIPKIDLFQVGYCRAPLGLSRKDRLWGIGKFPAGVALISNSSIGNLLFDTGYGQAFWQATQSFPEIFYRWLTPATLPKGARLPARLAALAQQVDAVFLSHLHADHAAGLFDLPNLPRLYTSQAAIKGLDLGPIASLRAGCPMGLRDRLRKLPFMAVETLPEHELPQIGRGYDLTGSAQMSGQMIAISLPGHGIGQMGLYLPKADLAGQIGPVFLVADAIWGLAALRANAPPPQATLKKLGDAQAYLAGFAALRALHLARPDIRIIASHCQECYPQEQEL